MSVNSCWLQIIPGGGVGAEVLELLNRWVALSFSRPLLGVVGYQRTPCGPVCQETYEGAQLDLSESPLHAIEWARVVLDEAR